MELSFQPEPLKVVKLRVPLPQLEEDEGAESNYQRNRRSSLFYNNSCCANNATFVVLSSALCMKYIVYIDGSLVAINVCIAIICALLFTANI